MRRPLLSVCICLFVIGAFIMQCTNPPPWQVDNTGWEGEQVTIIGQVYDKEYRVANGEEKLLLYLNSVYYSDSTENNLLQNQNYSNKLSKINSFEKIICDIAEMDSEEAVKVPALGSRIIIKGKWEAMKPATNPGEFDAAGYYAIEGICARVQDAVILDNRGGCWQVKEALYRLRRNLLKNLYEVFPQKEASILAKMLLGDGSGLDKEIRELYQSNGIVHILSISGLHISMLGMGLYWLLRRFMVPVIPAAIVGGSVIFLYGIMTGFSISAVRAIGMYLIHMLGEIIGKTYDMLTAMGVLGITMFMDNPLLVYHSGFLLSFGSVCGLGVLSPILQISGEYLRKKTKESKWIVICRTAGNKFVTGLITSLSVSLFILPIQLFFFYRIPLYSVYLNLLVIPFMSIVMIIGLLVMAFPVLSFLCPIEIGIFKWFEWLCLNFEKIPGHNLLFGRPQVGKIICYYLILLLAIGVDKYHKKWLTICILTISVIMLLWSGNHGLEIFILDVGQGDCICVRTEDNRCFLFDGGSSSKQNIGEKVIQPFLEYQGIGKIHGIFLSHKDEDHYNGIIQLLEQDEIIIERIYLPNVESMTSFGKQLRKMSNADIQFVERGDVWKVGEFTLECLHPAKNYSADDNTSSACFLLREGEFSMLLTGDVEGEGEMLLLEELKKRKITHINALKVAHHGSVYSTSEEFLKQVTPIVAFISCGRRNVYGHPHAETLERLERTSTKIWSTTERGAIKIDVKRKEIKGYLQRNK